MLTASEASHPGGKRWETRACLAGGALQARPDMTLSERNALQPGQAAWSRPRDRDGSGGKASATATAARPMPNEPM